MEDCKPVNTSMVSGCKLSKEDKSKEIDQSLYRSMIGILLYVTNFKVRHNAGSRVSWNISSCTQGKTCTRS